MGGARRQVAWLLLAGLALGLPARVPAARVILRIQAGNPIEQEQAVQIKSNLPAGVRTNHILTLDGLDLGYDVKTDLYYVHRELTLGPREIRVFNVEIEDIWTIAPAELSALREHAASMLERLEGREPFETATALEARVRENLARIEQRQRENAIGPGVRPIHHIRAYDANQEALKRVKLDLGHIENLVLGTGQDPGAMLGEDRRSPKPERYLDAADAYTKTAVMRVTVRNTSPNQARTVREFRRELPPEIRENDVIDSDGLELFTDPERGVAYLHQAEIELEPLEERVFEVVIRDKWNINASRIEALREKGTDILGRVAARELFHSVEASLQALLDDLAAIEAQVGPETVNERYVAFYRNQQEQLDDVERRLNRIIMALPKIEPTTRFGFKVKPPSARTTWLIIYIILGFLLVLSIVFYARWNGRSKAERFD